VTDRCRQSRDQLVRSLNEGGIETRPIFYPMHLHSYYARGSDDRLREAETLSARGLNLPTSPKLTVEDLTYVTETMARLARGSG